MRLSDHDTWAREHHGLLTLAASGLSNDAWQRATRAGSLIEVHRHVARLPGAPITTRQRIAAAVLAAGDGAMASHSSAAVLWDLHDAAAAHGPFVHVTVRDARRHPRVNGVVLHRPTDRVRLRPQRRDGIACTNALRTLCDLGADDPTLVVPAVGRALRAGLVDLDALITATLEHGKQGRSGIPALRAAVDEWMIDHRPADSVLETAFANLVRRHRLPAVIFHERIEGWEVDFRFVGTAVIVECDGWGSHGLERAQFERDRRKDLDLTAAGWQVLRLSYRAIVTDPADTAARVRRTLDRWEHLVIPSVA